MYFCCIISGIRYVLEAMYYNLINLHIRKPTSQSLVGSFHFCSIIPYSSNKSPFEVVQCHHQPPISAVYAVCVL
jgi:hypothetical protein